jgi:predicted nuclease of predicted toxin-antitoxin system
LRFLVDACVPRAVAELLRDRGHDVAETRDRGRDPGDATVLRWAAGEGRILVSMDKDFGALVHHRAQAHAGILRLPHGRIADIVGMVRHLLDTHDPKDLERAMVTIRGSRIRIARRK